MKKKKAKPAPLRNLVIRDMILAGKGRGAAHKMRHKNERRAKDAGRLKQELE